MFVFLVVRHVYLWTHTGVSEKYAVSITRVLKLEGVFLRIHSTVLIPHWNEGGTRCSYACELSLGLFTF
jgi:hypothetical protein